MFKLGLLKIPVTDLERAAAFYRDVLGFTEVFVVVEYGWGQFQVDELPIALYVPGMGGGDRQPGGSIDFHLEVSDVEACHDAWVEQGAVIPAGVVRSDEGSSFFEVTDPDGNALKITQAEESDAG